MTANYYMRYLVVSSPLVAAASVSAVSRNLRAWLNIQNLDLPLGPSPRNSWPSGAPHLPQLTWQAGTATIASSTVQHYRQEHYLVIYLQSSFLLFNFWDGVRMKGVWECWPGGLVRILGGAARWHFRSITVPSLTARTWRTARSRTWRTRTPRWRSGPCTSPPSWRRRTLSSCSPPLLLTLSVVTQLYCVLCASLYSVLANIQTLYRYVCI